MSIQKLRAFMKTIEYGNMTKAAESMNYTQSGISRMIQDLEEEWGVILIERSRNGVTLTPDGTRLYPKIQQICLDYDLLNRQLEEIHEVKTGLIRIGTISSVATHWLPKTIAQFKLDYPLIEFELLLGDYLEIESWILEGRVDFGLLRIPTIAKLYTVPLLTDQLLAVIPVTNRYAKEEAYPFEALVEEPFMLLEKGGKTEISAIFEDHNLSPNIQFTTWDDYAIMSMVESGLGISILPELILQRIPYEILSKPLSIPAKRTLGIAMRDERLLTAATRKFLNYLQSMNKL